MSQNIEPVLITQPDLPEFEKLIPYLKDIWDRKWLTNNGAFHQELEIKLAEYLNVPYVSLFSNGTLALITAIQCFDLSGEVITTPYSFVATTHSLWWNNIKPVFVDIENVYGNIDTSKIEAAITPNTTAILAVHVYGNPCNTIEIERIAKKYNLKVIYDAAHAFGVEYNGVNVLNSGDLSILSFHATKVFNTFEGGAIISHSIENKKRIDLLKNFGIQDEDTIVSVGINAKMNEFQSAIGLLQLQEHDERISKRKKVFEYYFDKLNSIDGIRLVHSDKNTLSNYAYLPILVDSEIYPINRDELFIKLKNQEIIARKYFYPLISNIETYKSLESSAKDNLKVANNFSNQVICLPIFPDLEFSVIDRIINIIKS